jgi:hypothetical protein
MKRLPMALPTPRDPEWSMIQTASLRIPAKLNTDSGRT